MLKEKFFNFILILFFGILFVYITYEPPRVMIKYPNINEITNIMYFEENENEGEQCNAE
jgi:hypothetical protein